MNVLVLTHYYAYGPAYDLEHYLRPTANTLTIVEVPLMQGDTIVKARSYRQGRKVLSYEYKLPKPLATLFPLERSIEYILTLLIPILEDDYDLAIAQDPLMTTLAIILKKLRKVNYVVFQSHNYTAPQRSSLYKLLDYYATVKCDCIWALSKRLAEIRRRLGAKCVLHVPVCIRDDVVDHALGVNRPKEPAAVYIGGLSKEKGVDILLKLIPTLLRYFDNLYIIGKGPFEKAFMKLQRAYSKGVHVLGYKPLEQAMTYARISMLGLVFSRPSLEVLTTDPMKPKVYLAAETPILVPKYLEISNDVSEFNAGVVIKSLSTEYIRKELERLRLLDKYLEGARKLAKSREYFRCSRVLEVALSQTLEYL